jgi:hypothetical protein
MEPNLRKQIERKAFSTDPTYGTYWDTQRFSEIPRMNMFPYPFYFVSNPFSEEATVYPRRAGWSPQIFSPQKVVRWTDYPGHCFQQPCNTTITRELPPPPSPGAPGGGGSGGGGGGGSGGGCVPSKCINLER